MTLYHSLLENFASQRILCIGDVMIDRFVKGGISRISPEAPIPVLHVEDEMTILGGAGNVVRNLEALGAKVTFLSVVGEDREGELVRNLLNELPNVSASLLTDPHRPTTFKTRFIAANQQVLRTDREQVFPLPSALEKELLDNFKKLLPDHHLVVISDYAKGLFSSHSLQTMIHEANAARKPLLVDPKGRDYSRYKGATLLTPNHHELLTAVSAEAGTDSDLIAVAQRTLDQYELSALIVTRGEQGMTLVSPSGTVEHLPTKALEVFDVSGAGDTVIATLAVSLAAGASYSDAMTLANTAAGLVVAKVGTAIVRQEELSEALHSQEVQDYENKIVSWQQAEECIQTWKRRGQRIVFTNGCFDLLHPGHISLLSEAKKRGERLVIGLNTDASVQRLKGPTRPVQQETARAFVLSSLECVDLVVLFDQDTPLELIQMLKPNTLVKGADYTLDKVVGASFVQSYGGEIHLVNLVEGQSTTRMISKMGT